jgi:branched-chain amino acid transport system substrate-binding protein
MKKWVLFLVVGLALALGISVLLKSRQKDALRIGVILPLTGPGAPYGNQVMEGINVAAAEAVAQGLVEKERLKLIVEDDKTETAQGVNAINKLISADGVRVVIGALASSVTLACAPVAEREKVLLLSPGSSSDLISEAGDYIFRIAPRDSYDGEFLARAMSRDFGVKSAAILHLDNDFGVGLMKSFVAAFEGNGGKVVMRESFPMGSSDFRTQITKLKTGTFDALLLIAAGNENVVALRQIREIGLKTQMFAPSTLNDPDLIRLAGESANGVIFSAASFDGIKNDPAVKAFFEAFSRAYRDKQPTTFTAYGYDSLMILLRAIKEKGYDSERIKTFLYSMPVFHGASGPTTFDAKGDALKELTLFRISDGKSQALAR